MTICSAFAAVAHLAVLYVSHLYVMGPGAAMSWGGRVRSSCSIGLHLGHVDGGVYSKQTLASELAAVALRLRIEGRRFLHLLEF